MATRGNQRHEGRGHGASTQAGRAEMAFQMIDGKQRDPQRVGQRLAVGDADQERTDESGPSSHRDRAQLVRADPRTGQGLPHNLVDGLDVAAAGQFGHYAPVAGMGLHLRTYDLGEHGTIRAGNGSGGFVTGCLDAQNHGWGSDRTGGDGAVHTEANW